MRVVACKQVGNFIYTVHLALVAVVLSSCGAPTVPTACKTSLDGVTQLVVVLTDTMTHADATITVLRRSDTVNDTAWAPMNKPYAAVVGRAGLGWGNGFEALRRGPEAVKREGDQRTPAGLYTVGPTFGHGDSPWPGHLKLQGGDHVCVDDVKSKYYGQIVPRQKIGANTSAEDMGAIAVYERGLVVDYPPNADKKSGSCIFFHIWQKPGEATAGCIASQDTQIAKLQSIAASAKTAVLIWSRSARARLEKCFPELVVPLFQKQNGDG